LKKLKNLNSDYTEFGDIFQLLDSLDATWITGHHAIKSVNEFIEENKEYEDLIYNIIDKNLKCRANASLINKVFPNLIPEFDIALAHKYEDHKKKVDFQKDDWYVARKLNGVRCIVIKEGDLIRYFSRTGKEYFTFKNLDDSVYSINEDSFVLDGEACIIDENGKEDFTAVVSEIRKKDYTIKNPKLMVFDFLTIEEFNNKKSKTKLSERFKRFKKYNVENGRIEVLKQTKIDDEEHFKEFQDISAENGWEGLILRKDVPYKGKRTNELLKFKLFEDDEFVVKDIETGLIRHIIYDENGESKEIESEMMTRAVIEYKGFPVGVGSGWSINQRLEYYNDPSKIIGKEITVQYFLPSKNKKGGESLQFPTVKCVWDERKDI